MSDCSITKPCCYLVRIICEKAFCSPTTKNARSISDCFLTKPLGAVHKGLRTKN